jgi:uncharacterized protein YifE (UPF0438 family)
LLLMLLVRLVVTWLRGNECGWRRPLKKIWSAGDVVEEGESGVRDPNSKSESSWFGVLGNEKEHSHTVRNSLRYAVRVRVRGSQLSKN